MKPESGFVFTLVCEIHSEKEMCEMPYADRITLGGDPLLTPDPTLNVSGSAQHHPSQDRCALVDSYTWPDSVAPSREVSPMPMHVPWLPKRF